MKVTKNYIKRLIKEELENALNEAPKGVYFKYATRFEPDNSGRIGAYKVKLQTADGVLYSSDYKVYLNGITQEESQQYDAKLAAGDVNLYKDIIGRLGLDMEGRSPEYYLKFQKPVKG